jgi:hypothetical protein
LLAGGLRIFQPAGDSHRGKRVEMPRANGKKYEARAVFQGESAQISVVVRSWSAVLASNAAMELGGQPEHTSHVAHPSHAVIER